MLTVNGRFFGSEVRPRRFSRDYVLSCCDEAAKRREALRGKTPTTWVKGKPQLTGERVSRCRGRCTCSGARGAKREKRKGRGVEGRSVCAARPRHTGTGQAAAG